MSSVGSRSGTGVGEAGAATRASRPDLDDAAFLRSISAGRTAAAEPSDDAAVEPGADYVWTYGDDEEPDETASDSLASETGHAQIYAPGYGVIERDPSEAFSAGGGLGFDYALGAETREGGDRPLPRITMHAFCASRSTLDLLSTVQSDRRMAQVTAEIYEGAITSAIHHYATEITPNLLILEAPVSYTHLTLPTKA